MSFRLEGLEPRILLSGDPVLTDLARMAASPDAVEVRSADDANPDVVTVAAAQGELDESAAEAATAVAPETAVPGATESEPGTLAPAEAETLTEAKGEAKADADAEVDAEAEAEQTAAHRIPLNHGSGASYGTESRTRGTISDLDLVAAAEPFPESDLLGRPSDWWQLNFSTLR